MKTITLSDGTVFEMESYSFGNYGALILIIKASMAEIFTAFTRDAASAITLDLGKDGEPVIFSGYTKIAFISAEGSNVRLALEKEAA